MKEIKRNPYRMLISDVEMSYHGVYMGMQAIHACVELLSKTYKMDLPDSFTPDGINLLLDSIAQMRKPSDGLSLGECIANGFWNGALDEITSRLRAIVL